MSCPVLPLYLVSVVYFVLFVFIKTTQQRPDTEATLGTTCDEDKHHEKHNRDETRYRGNTGHARHMMKTNKTKYTTETRPDTEATLGTLDI
jgi:hypothetical protein